MDPSGIVAKEGVVPFLNAHKRHVRDPFPFPITLLEVRQVEDG
jgi:hypothetical protein